MSVWWAWEPCHPLYLNPLKNSIVLGTQDNIIEIGGKIIPVEFMNNMRMEIGPFSLDHSFIVCPQSPLSLMGRDLCKLGATISCNQNGLTLGISAKYTQFLVMEKRQLHVDLRDLPSSL